MGVHTAASIFGTDVTECSLLVSDSFAVTRSMVDWLESSQNASASRLLVTPGLYTTLGRDDVCSHTIQGLLDREQLDVRIASEETPLSNVALSKSELRVVLPEHIDSLERPFGTAADSQHVHELTEAYESLFENAARPEEPIAERSLQDLVAFVESTFDGDAAADFERALTGAQRLGQPGDPVSLFELLCVIAAKHNQLVNTLATASEDAGIMSRPSVSYSTNALEAAGLIEKKRVNDGTVGRPPTQLSLTDGYPGDTAGYVEFLRRRLAEAG